MKRLVFQVHVKQEHHPLPLRIEQKMDDYTALQRVQGWIAGIAVIWFFAFTDLGRTILFWMMSATGSLP